MRETVQLTRRVTFSSGHRYWIDGLSEEENRERFGPWASPYNHGHNYVLEVTAEGVVDAETGMVVNIKDIDDVLQQVVVDPFDQKSINDQVEAFRERSTSTESLLQFFAEQLSSGVLPSESKLVHLRLEETPSLICELDINEMPKTSLTRVYEFAASHRLHVPTFSVSQNRDLFGKCNNPAGHGHNYVLEVTVEGVPDVQSGMIADIGAIDSVVEREVVDRYDHKHLNEDIPEFQGKVTSSEIVAQEIFRRLEGQLPAKLKRVRLLETARNIFTVEA